MAIQLKPDDTIAYLNRGIAKALLKQPWAAKEDIRKAWRLADQTGDEDLKIQVEKALSSLE